MHQKPAPQIDAIEPYNLTKMLLPYGIENSTKSLTGHMLQTVFKTVQITTVSKYFNGLTPPELLQRPSNSKNRSQYLGENSGWKLFWIADKNQLCSTILQRNKVVHFCALTSLSSANSSDNFIKQKRCKMHYNSIPWTSSCKLAL